MFEPPTSSPLVPAPPSSDGRERGREELEDRIAALQADINAANARLITLVEEHARHEDWRVHQGVNSEAYFLSWRLGLSPYAARSLVEVAEGLRALPRIRAAFRAGRLSIEQVRALVQVATPEDEPELLYLALGMSGSQLARFCAYYRRILRIEGGRHRARFLRTSYTSDGMWRISGRLPSEEGAIVDQAIGAAAASRRAQERAEDREDTGAAHQGIADHPADEPADPAGADDPFGAEEADALVHVAASFLQGRSAPHRRDDRYLVVIHADEAALRGGEGKVQLEGGGEIPAEAASRIACEAPIVALLERGGQPLSVGRKTRRIGRALRRALEGRDGQCRFPGCHRRGRLQAHHIIHWPKGETSPENLLLLCRSHHVAVHEGGLVVERALEGFLFRRADGTVIRQPELRAEGPGIGHDNRHQGIDVTPQTCAPEWAGERGSIAYVVDVFASRSPPRSATA